MAEVAALPSAALEAMGQCGRSYVLANYSKAVGVRKLANVTMGAKANQRS